MADTTNGNGAHAEAAEIESRETILKRKFAGNYEALQGVFTDLSKAEYEACQYSVPSLFHSDFYTSENDRTESCFPLPIGHSHPLHVLGHKTTPPDKNKVLTQKPVFKKRAEIFKKIDKFWLESVSSPLLSPPACTCHPPR